MYGQWCGLQARPVHLLGRSDGGKSAGNAIEQAFFSSLLVSKASTYRVAGGSFGRDAARNASTDSDRARGLVPTADTVAWACTTHGTSLNNMHT